MRKHSQKPEEEIGKRAAVTQGSIQLQPFACNRDCVLSFLCAVLIIFLLKKRTTKSKGYEGNPFSFYVFKIQVHQTLSLQYPKSLHKNSNLLHAEVELSLHFCNRGMSSQEIPSRRLKVKPKEAEPKFRRYFPMQRCCSISL